MNYFTALSLNDRSSQLTGLLDGISNGIQTIQNASKGIDGITKLVGSLQLNSESINTWKNGVERALKKYIQDGTEAKGKKCPNCGNETLVYQEGCLICTTCGASRCG